MKTLGLLGGIGPESTINYYRDIIGLYRTLTGKDEYPNILINSINMTGMLDLVGKKKFSELADYLASEINRLIAAGADICAVCSNTPHIVFDRLKDRVPVPLLSIVEAAAQEAESKGLRKLLLTGTAFTMENDFYSKSFMDRGIEIIVPDRDARKVIHDTIFPELEAGIVIPEKKARLIELCTEIISENSLDGIILGCTELPLMVSDDDFDVKVLDTVTIHVRKIVSTAMENAAEK